MFPQQTSILKVFPETASVNSQNHLVLGGCDAVELASQFGTPLYVFDEATLRGNCTRFIDEFTKRYGDTLVIYACKAFINRALAVLFKEVGLGLDVVSAGELSIAQSVAFPMEKIYFHGNNKAVEELRLAIEAGVGRIVIDNFYELSVVNGVAAEAGVTQDVLLRLSPGIDPHTHSHTATGVIDSKFGFPIFSGQAEAALVEVMSASHLRLVGLHAHLGSPIFEMEPYREAMRTLLCFAAEMRDRHGFQLGEMSPGGGFAIQYTEDTPAPDIADYAEAITSTLIAESRAQGLPYPRLIVEPGRSIVGPAGVALYRVGAVKDIPGVRRYVSVDGGMADNIRPALYGARYEAVVANKIGEGQKSPEATQRRVTIAGKFCESGDVLIRDIELPPLDPGDIIAIPAAGAYCLSMASNYNCSLKPAIVLVKDGQARLIRRRESYDDLIRCDLL